MTWHWWAGQVGDCIAYLVHRDKVTAQTLEHLEHRISELERPDWERRFNEPNKTVERTETNPTAPSSTTMAALTAGSQPTASLTGDTLPAAGGPQ